MLRQIFAVLAFSTPFFAHAATPINVSCGQSVKAFFAPLIQQRLINPKPFSVGSASLNLFQPRLFKSMTAYGMPVVMVFGYTNDPLLFIQKGEPKGDVYGVTVREGIANVQAQLNSMSANDARTFRVDERQTMILCKGEME